MIAPIFTHIKGHSMKHSAIVFSLMFSSLSFAGTFGNGVQLSNLPTASKTYSVTAFTEAEVAVAKEKIVANCKKDQAEAKAIIAKLGSKVLSSEGCSVNVSGGFYDQAGSDYKVSTQFEIVFK